MKKALFLLLIAPIWVLSCSSGDEEGVDSEQRRLQEKQLPAGVQLNKTEREPEEGQRRPVRRGDFRDLRGERAAAPETTLSGDVEEETLPRKTQSGAPEDGEEILKAFGADVERLLAGGSEPGYVHLQGEETVEQGQPLYVIDGVPMDGTRRASAGRWSDQGYSNPTDIRDDNIADIRVLYGEQARDKYGEMGRHGVIEIITFSGTDEGLSYIKSEDGTVYSREEAAAKGFQELLKQQKDQDEKK